MEDIATPANPLPDDYPQLCLMFTNSIKTSTSSGKVELRKCACVRVRVCACARVCVTVKV